MWRRVLCSICLIVAWVLIQGDLAYAFNPDKDSSLVGCWKLDETSGTVAHDSSGNGNDGTVLGNPQWTTGKVKGTLDLDGAGDYIDCGNAPILTFTDAITVSVWVNIRTVSSAWMAAVAKGENAWRISCNNTSQTFHFGITYYTNANYSANGTIQVGLNEWHHVTGTYENSTIKLYVDGVLDTTTTGASPMGKSTTSLLIGENPEATGRYWNGLIDDVRLYRKALSASDISVIMSGLWAPVAENPSPADKGIDVPRDAVLTWTPGPFAKTHDVYFGTDSEDVNAATRTDSKGLLVGESQDANTYDPPGLLAFGQTYYWRVDEVNAAPDFTIFKGETWSFTAETYGYAVKPIKATASSSMSATMGPDKTIDGSGLDALDQHGTSATQMWTSKKGQSPIWIQYEFDKAYKLHQMWVWNSNQAIEEIIGFGAEDVTIETSLDGTTWTALDGVPEFAQATGEPNYVHNTTVDFGGIQAKYVKLTINSNWAGNSKQASLSEVRFFYVPVKAFSPSPASGATGVAIDATLNWRPGREAVRHEVYLGTDPNALTLTKAVPSHRLDLGPLGLLYGTTYYWKVNEVNEAASPNLWEGDVWSFSIPSYAVVDDFESYNDQCNRIFFAWADGYGYSASSGCGVEGSTGNGSGSTVGNASPPFAERTIVHGGQQAMPMGYDNTSGKGYSEATRTFDVARDWTRGGAKTLVLWFHGDLGNGAGQLYVKINNVRVDYNGSTTALGLSMWKQWNIDLTSVSGLQAVKTLTIGVSGSGKGVLYIDDILLYRVAPAAVVPADPGAASLQAYYPFDGSTNDSSAHGYNGAAMGNQAYADALTGHGKAIQLNGTDDYVDLPIGTLVSTLTSTTVASWVNFSNTGAGWERIFDFGTGTTDYMFLTPRQGTTGALTFAILATGGTEKRFAALRTLGTGWHHVAVVMDSGTMNVNVYVDGDVVASDTTTVLPKDLGKTTQNWLGRSQFTADAYFGGLLDEFRIYNRALTAGEVRYLAGDR